MTSRTATIRYRRGYALLVTLVMLALLGVIIGQLARQSADQAVQARAAEHALRQGWAERSCRRVLLARAPQRFEYRQTSWLASLQAESESGTPVVKPPQPFETLKLQLSGVVLWLRIDDENAKINLNERLRNDPQAQLTPALVVRELLQPTHAPEPRLTQPRFVQHIDLEPLGSWPQALPGQTPQQMLGVQEPAELLAETKSQGAPSRLTMWGSGQLNIYSVDDETIRKRFVQTVEPATLDNLSQVRRAEPGVGLDTLIENATPEQPDDRATLRAGLTDRSGCYAMWLATRPDDSPKAASRWSFSVLESSSQVDPAGTRSIQTFSW